MKFENAIVKILNNGLKRGENFDFTEFKITPKNCPDIEYYIIRNKDRFCLIDGINYAEMIMESED